MSCCKQRILIAGLLAALGVAAVAQEKSGATFKSRSEMVLVPVLVREHGAHVRGLTKDDFTVLENGSEQKLAVFEEVAATANKAVRPTNTMPQTFSNARTQGSEQKRLNIIVLDTLNIDFTDQGRARDAIVRFLAQSVSPDELTTLLVMRRDGFTVIHDFTTDTSVLISALRRVGNVNGGLQGDKTSAEINDETEKVQGFLLESPDQAGARFQAEYVAQATIDGLDAIAKAYGGVPGRKSMVWITGGVGFKMDTPNAAPGNRTFEEQIQRVFARLNQANIALYPIDARGLLAFNIGASAASTSVLAGSASGRSPSGSGTSGLTQLGMLTDAGTDAFLTMINFADMTGGRAFYNTNDIVHSLEVAANDSTAYYMLGYYAKSSKKAEWRRLAVKLKRRGLEVRTRNGYYSTPEGAVSEAVMRKRDFDDAVRSPYDFTSVPVTIRWTTQQPAQDGKRVAKFDVIFGLGALQVDESDNNHMDFEWLATALDPARKVAGSNSERLDGHLTPERLTSMNYGGLTLTSRELSIPPGEYRVKLVVRDNLSGKVGSVTAPLTVR